MLYHVKCLGLPGKLARNFKSKKLVEEDWTIALVEFYTWTYAY